MLPPEVIEAIFRQHGVPGPWGPLPSTGVANLVYATPDVVLRVATDHPEAVADARTESVAAPIARAAGIRTPRLFAFDDTRAVVDRPFSLWERVHGFTLASLDLPAHRRDQVWLEVGRELAKLHLGVRECPDPSGYLDQPAREPDLEPLVRRLVESNGIDGETARALDGLISCLRGQLEGAVDARFLHYDAHPSNLLCSDSGRLLAVIDWGDAGWGDPTLEFACVPLEALPTARAGYEAEAPGLLGPHPDARFLWDKLHVALDDRDVPRLRQLLGWAV